MSPVCSAAWCPRLLPPAGLPAGEPPLLAAVVVAVVAFRPLSPLMSLVPLLVSSLSTPCSLFRPQC
eukprot:3924536-Amphidinium_carterae.1